MANIIPSKPEFFYGGADGASALVGVTYGVNRVVRYSFISPSDGATDISLSFAKVWPWSEGTPQYELYFYIGTDPNSHKNAGGASIYTGILNYTVKSDGYGYFEGTTNISLLPNTTYYLFVFPATVVDGSWQWQTNIESVSIISSGNIDVIYIDNGNKLVAYQIYIDNGTSWDLYIRYIDNGVNWEAYS